MSDYSNVLKNNRPPRQMILSRNHDDFLPQSVQDLEKNERTILRLLVDARTKNENAAKLQGTQVGS